MIVCPSVLTELDWTGQDLEMARIMMIHMMLLPLLLLVGGYDIHITDATTDLTNTVLGVLLILPVLVLQLPLTKECQLVS